MTVASSSGATTADGMGAGSMTKMIGRVHLEAIEKRGISPETAVKLGLYTGRSDDGEVVPDQNGNILVFPYQHRGVVVAEKYLGPQKRFWQRAGGRRTFWNSDVLDDPSLESVIHPLIITEGEFDAIAAIDCGFPFSVSVPDGAPAVKAGDDPGNLPAIDPTQEQIGKFEFLWNNRERLKRIARFIIAVDSDPPGQRLAAELVRRLSAARCAFVEYPAACKDINDVLMKYGREMVATVLQGARPYPVRGLYRLDDYPDLPPLPTHSTGWRSVDRHLRLFAGEFMVVTGIPSMGKSTWVLNLLVNIFHNEGWRSAIFSPEMPTVPHLRDKLRRIIGGCRADEFIQNAFVFIDSDPTGHDVDDNFDLGWILDKATDAVLRHGVRVLLIDPWNEIEHARKREETTTDYIARSIRQIKRFARQYDVAVIVIAHPTKDVNDKGKARVPTLYDVEGSAAWFNKADHGVCIHRPDPYADEASIYVQKVRFDETGEKGEVRMSFNRATARYFALDDKRSEEAA
jgi:twinkle protein